MSFYINSSRHYLNEVMAAFALETMADMLVLDAGAGDAPYRHLFRHVRYETADLKTVDKPYADVTYECDLADIPVEDNRFDWIIFNQVLEHVPDPANVLAELCRVMKPGVKWCVQRRCCLMSTNSLMISTAIPSLPMSRFFRGLA